jgi:hypothetical protein
MKYLSPASDDFRSRRLKAVRTYAATDIVSIPRKRRIRSRADAMNIIPTVARRMRV